MKSYLTLTVILVAVFYVEAQETTTTPPNTPLTPPPGSTLAPGGITWKNCTRPNEYYTCGSACQTTCATLGQTCPIVNIRCNDDCYCIEGYARDAENNCIPIKDCPKRRPCQSTCKRCNR
ncbi:inducible metalloproteinase inhibitor protein-like [Diabrotica virgifera virgifera]|uniref:TIL domain-containing protein n=1 Tax=Diabrotica virgifera virgifera TaxID=50390 RepID=A0ABM5KNP2_DIAVI|nr:inducible metalloproteinase inhibitor protein-like [Diabrotica virgifera virgifera]